MNRKRTRSEELAFQAEDLALDVLIKPKRTVQTVVSRSLKPVVKEESPHVETLNLKPATVPSQPKVQTVIQQPFSIVSKAETYTIDKTYTNIPYDARIPFFEDPNREDTFYAIENWCKKPEKHPKPLLLIGPPGCGKTFCLLHYTKFHIEAYDDHDLDDFLHTKGLYARPPAMFDCIEHLEVHEKSALKKVLESKHQSRRIILTSEDAFVEPAKTWAKLCHVIKIEAPSASFIKKCLTETWKELWPATWGPKCSEIIDSIQEASRQNIQAAVAQLQFYGKQAPNETQTLDVGALDTFTDVPKMVYKYLYGTAGSSEVAMGSADVSFLAQMLQLNTLQNSQAPMRHVDRSLTQWSFYDIIDRYIETDILFAHMDLYARNIPKIANNSRCFLQWPKSTKPLEKPTMSLNTLPTEKK